MIFLGFKFTVDTSFGLKALESDDDDGIGRRNTVPPLTLLIGFDIDSVAEEFRGSILDSDPGNDVDESTVTTTIQSSDACDDFEDGDSEAADDEDYDVQCNSCQDCIARTLARHNAKCHSPVVGTSLRFTFPVIDRAAWCRCNGYTAGQDSWAFGANQFIEQGPLYSQDSIGSGLYRPWSMPVGDRCPSGNSHQGQKPKTSNVTESVTPEEVEEDEDNMRS